MEMATPDDDDGAPKSCKNVVHLVADAGAFLKHAKLQDIGDSVYTVREVIAEIRDESTRQRLAVLPYDIQMVEPEPSSLKTVTEFAKKTGDFPALSATDLKVLAATHMLHLRHNINRAEMLKVEPNNAKTYGPSAQKLAGFHHGRTSAGNFRNKISGAGEETYTDSSDRAPVDLNSHCLQQAADAGFTANSDAGPSVVEEEGMAVDEIDNDDDVEDDDADWITPGNLVECLKNMNASHLLPTEHESVPVACLTTDFAMQNVLMHMAMHVVSVDGLLIKQLKNYVLRCRACNGTTTIMTKKFCPKCGNAALHRCAVTLEQDGTTRYHLSAKWQPSTRGMKYSLPAPEGGKHGNDPVLFEDQRIPQNYMSRKAMQRVNPMSDDFVAGDSPFSKNDTTSRSALLGVRGLHKSATRKNPNSYAQGKKRGGKKR